MRAKESVARDGAMSAESLCELARPLIRSKARKLVGKAGITPSDREDIEQEIYLRLLQTAHSCPQFTCPPMVLIVRVVNQSIANQLRDRTAQKRDSRSVKSLNGAAGPAARDDLGDAIRDARRPCASDNPSNMADLGLDLDEVLAELTQEQRELCDGLGIDSVSELARRLDTPRTTLNDKIRKVRRALEDRGLQDYLA